MPKAETYIRTTAVAVLVTAWAMQMAGYNQFRLLMHANPAHLALNCWAAWGLWRRPWWLMLPAFLIGWIGIAVDRHAIGFSAALFALMGLRWNIYDCTANRLLVAALLALSLALPQMAFTAHALPFAAALALGYACRYINRYRHDTIRK